MKSVPVAVLAVIFLAPSIVVAQQQQAPEPELQRPAMPSMEGQQGPVVSATAVSPPSKKKHDAAAVEPYVKPQPAKKPAPEAKSSPKPPPKVDAPKAGPQKAPAKPIAVAKTPAKKLDKAKPAPPKKVPHASPTKAKKK